LFNEATLKLCADIDAHVIVVNDRRLPTLEPLHFMAALAELGVPVEQPLRSSLANKVLGIIEDGTPHEKGRRLEALLAFLFSSVRDLRVVERNFETDTQEIDIVLQVDNFSNRVWRMSGPLLLVESKNTKDATPQNVVSLLIHKIRGKRGACKLGFLVSLNGFTSDAMREELRISESENCVAMLDKDDLIALFEAEDLDEELEKIVRRAMLR
jgi:hypothetical protein